MPKETPRAKALKAMQKLVRLKAADDNGYCECVTCGAVAKWSEMDGGHYIPKSHSSYWALREENIHPQCKGCNGYGMKYGDAPQRYTLWMIDYYGRDFVDQMHKDKRKLAKYYKSDYLEIIADCADQIKYHLKRIA